MKRSPGPTIGRVSLYLRLLSKLREAGVRTVSSQELARRSGSTAVQVRKDLSLVGASGTRGKGYPVVRLEEALRSRLGLDQRRSVALVGAGRIGQALLGSEAFRCQGFHIEAVFDADPDKIGVRWHGLEVQSDARLEAVLVRAGIEIAVVAVPARAAQPVVSRLVGAGVRGILSFAPTRLDVPPGVVIQSVDTAAEMERLSYALFRGEAPGRQAASTGVSRESSRGVGAGETCSGNE